MKSEEFRVWLREVKMMTSSTVNSRVKNCEVVERYEGNLDTLFSKDKLSGLLKKLDSVVKLCLPTKICI